MEDSGGGRGGEGGGRWWWCPPCAGGCRGSPEKDEEEVDGGGVLHTLVVAGARQRWSPRQQPVLERWQYSHDYENYQKSENWMGPKRQHMSIKGNRMVTFMH